MSNFSITSSDFNEGEEIPKKFGYKFENVHPTIEFDNIPQNTKSLSIIMDDPDAMAAVGKVWVHWLLSNLSPQTVAILTGETPMKTLEEGEDDDEIDYLKGKTDFDEIGYGGPAPPNGRHTYVFKGYALDTMLDLKEGYSKEELEDAMKGHIIAESKLTGTFI
ncbi:MAG: YbhB/YbcL family Raf kinase inhibitor-like protein [Candidatus Nitrosopumilus sp. metabat.KBP569_Feb_25m_nospike.7]|jgi:Raf kinase inhibitor-like YbhB/YbcL family protein|nr:YbhB/YbcL family Raf kinase inhibitor-like protein [Nitrosopumilus sp.]